MQRGSGFQLLAALQQRELTGAAISAAQVMPQLIRAAKYYIQEYAVCTIIDNAKDILHELKYLALQNVDCVIDFYSDELWKQTCLDVDAQVRIRKRLVRDILQIFQKKQHPKLAFYINRVMSMLPCDLDFGLPDIKNEINMLEQAAASRGHYATSAAYLLFIIYIQEAHGELNNFCLNQIFINYCHLLPAYAEAHNIQNLRLRGREAIAELGCEKEIGVLALYYRDGNDTLGIPVDHERAACLRRRLQKNKEFLRNKIQEYYTLACQNTVNDGLIFFEVDGEAWHIFHLMKLYAEHINAAHAEMTFIIEVQNFKNQLLAVAESGNIHAMHWLVKLGDLQSRMCFKRSDLPESYLNHIIETFSDINLISWCEKIVALTRTETTLQARAARRLACTERSEIRRAELLQLAAECGCWRSVIDLGVMALENGKDEDAVLCFKKALTHTHSSEMLHRLLTAFNKVDVLYRIQLLPIYFSICAHLIANGEPYRLGKLIALVSTLNDWELAERWRNIRRMYNDGEVNVDALHALTQETVARFMAAASAVCSDGRLKNC